MRRFAALPHNPPRWNSRRAAGFNLPSSQCCVGSRPSWRPPSGARRKSSFWSALPEPTRNLRTATIAARDRQKLWCVPPACAITILRAPLLLGPEPKARQPWCGMREGPKAKLIGGGRNFQQPLYVDDLARAALAACQPSVARNRTLDLVGPVSLPERELVERAARLLGRQVRVSSIPKGLLSFCAGHSPARLRPWILGGRSRSDHRRHASGLAAGRQRNWESNSPA